MAKTGLNGKHDIQPAEIHFDDSSTRALSESPGRLRMQVVVEDVQYEVISYVRFISRLERYQQHWFLISFEAIYESDNLIPTFPTQKVPLTSPAAGFRKSYGITGWALEQAGFPINQNLPGIDRPETVKALMDKHFQWLKESQSRSFI